jgi:tetratricopeptide (TPR) repeat protein
MSAWLLAVLAIGCNSDTDRIDEIRLLQSQQRYAETLEPLREIIASNPEDAQAHYLYGMAHLMTHNPSRALWSLRRASQDSEIAERADIALASAALATRNAQEAIEASTRVLEKTPEAVHVLILRAEAYEIARSYERELEDARLISSLEPSNSIGLVLEIKALLGLERSEEAEERFVELEERRAAGDFRDTAGRYCAARAHFSKQTGDMPLAEERFDECLEHYPSDRLVVQESVEFFDEIGKHERATEIIRGAMEATPENFSLRRGFAERQRSLGLAEEAERTLLEGTEMADPIPQQSWGALARHYFEQERFEESLDAWDHVLELYSDPSSQTLFAYADTLVAAGRFDSALEVADELSEVYAHLIRGRARLGQGRAREALDEFERGILLWPNNAVARYFAAQAAEQVGDFDRAISEYRDSLRADAAATDAGLRLGRLHFSEGEFQKAVEALRLHLEKAPRDVDALELRARVSAARGRPAEVQRLLLALNRVEGGTPRLVLFAAELVSQVSGPEAAAEWIESTPQIDLSLPENAAVLGVWVASLEQLGRGDEAWRRVESTLAAHPESAELNALHGRVIETKSGPSAASEAAYRRALELDPENGIALTALAEAEARRGDVEAAVSLYDRAAKADPADLASARLAADLLASAGRNDEAVVRLEELLLEHPYDGEAAAQLATRLGEQGADPARVQTLVERAARFGAG